MQSLAYAHVTTSNYNPKDFSMEEMVIVFYEGSDFPGNIMEIKIDGFVVSAMQKCSSVGWKWPTSPDVLFYYYDDVLGKVPSDCAIPCNHRGVFEIKYNKLSMW